MRGAQHDLSDDCIRRVVGLAGRLRDKGDRHVVKEVGKVRVVKGIVVGDKLPRNKQNNKERVEEEKKNEKEKQKETTKMMKKK